MVGMVLFLFLFCVQLSYRLSRSRLQFRESSFYGLFISVHQPWQKQSGAGDDLGMDMDGSRPCHPSVPPQGPSKGQPSLSLIFSNCYILLDGNLANNQLRITMPANKFLDARPVPKPGMLQLDAIGINQTRIYPKA